MLRKKGFLERDKKNKTKGWVNKDLQKIADRFLKENAQILMVNFKK